MHPRPGDLMSKGTEVGMSLGDRSGGAWWLCWGVEAEQAR